MGNQHKQEGFSLLEMLLILFLMMVLISMAAPQFGTAENSTRQQADLANRVLIEGAVDLYKLDTGKLPEGIDDLIICPLGVTGWRGPYLQQEIIKPTREGEPYVLDDRGRIIP